MSSTSTAVHYKRTDDVGLITLDRAANRNSMTPELLDAFAHASAAARADTGARCIVITGSGTSFSAGADFKSIVQREGDDPAERSYAMYEPFLSLLDIEAPVIGALNGHAIGGGFGLALLCDIRVGAIESKYGANFVRLGLAPGMAISYLLPRLVGTARACELLFSAQLVDGREAERIGILNHAVPAPEVLPRALELAQAIAGNAPFAVRETKHAIRRGLGLAIHDAARSEAAVQAQSLAMDDAREGITALLDKRAPKFTGR